MADEESQRLEDAPPAKLESQTEESTKVAVPGNRGLDPLIELPEPAKARIRAREADASEYLELVRKSLQSRFGDPARRDQGQRSPDQDKTGETVDVFHKELHDARATAAGHVFLAHATEYAAELPQPNTLAPVLAELRKAVIERHGEQVRALVQAREAQQIGQALNEQERTFASTDSSRGGTIIGDARFWRERRNDFREYNTAENGQLTAFWSSLLDRWTLSGPDESLKNFKSLAALAVQGIQQQRQAEPWVGWLDELRRAGRNCTDLDTSVTLSQEALDDPVKFGVERPVIRGVLRTGVVDAEAMNKLGGIDRPRLFAQWDYRSVSVTVDSLFGASADLCLDFEARGAIGKDQTRAPLRRSPKELVDAARRKPKRSHEKFAAVIGIGRDTLYAITKETRWVSDETYGLVAEACKCKPEDLHPRDIPRPERRRG